MARTGIFPKTLQKSEVSQSLIDFVTLFHKAIGYDASITYHHPDTFGVFGNSFGKQVSIESNLFVAERAFIHIVLGDFRLFVNIPIVTSPYNKRDYASYLETILRIAQEMGADYHVKTCTSFGDTEVHSCTDNTKKGNWWLSPTYPISGQWVKTFSEIQEHINSRNGYAQWIQPICGDIFIINHIDMEYTNHRYRKISNDLFIRI